MAKKHDQQSHIKEKLRQMVRKDQRVRKLVVSKDTASKKFNLMAQIDKDNTRELKRIIEKHGWITISKFGTEAASNAWLLVQHADRDPAFQVEILNIMESLCETKECHPHEYAYLYDRVAINTGKPYQLYGTQPQKDGNAFYPVKHPELLNERRKAMGLPPIEEYIQMIKKACSITLPIPS